MITINLLSPTQKQELKIKKIFIIIRELIMLFLLFSSIIAILLISSKYILEQQLADLIAKNSSQIEANYKINSQIVAINKKISQASNIQKNFKKWSSLLVDLSNITPETISFSLLKISYQNANLEIRGKAQSRDDLLAFKELLTKDEMFTKVDLPLSDLLSKNNNNFTITAQIDLEKIP